MSAAHFGAGRQTIFFFFFFGGGGGPRLGVRQPSAWPDMFDLCSSCMFVGSVVLPPSDSAQVDDIESKAEELFLIFF